MRTFVEVALLVWLLIGVLSSIATIGKERKPMTPGVACLTLVFAILMGVGVVYLAQA